MYIMGENMKIKDLKNFDKPIEKLINNGPNTLSTEELLAILINTGTKNESCIEIAKSIINSCNSLADMLTININQLSKFKGIKEKKAASIIAAIEFVKRCQNTFKPGITLENKEVIHNILLPKICNLRVEHLFIFYLDIKLKVIKLKEIASENPNIINLPIKGIIKEAISLDASFIILSHNHPSNNVEPSSSDIKSTIELDNSLKTVDLLLLDHVIVGRTCCYSMKEHQIF